MLTFTFLGTSAGMPSRSRNMSGLAVRTAVNKEWFLIDAGEGTQHRLLSLPFSFMNLAAILVTHAHGDHCYGLPGLLASMAMNQRQTPLTVWGPQSVLDWLGQSLALSEECLPFPLLLRSTDTEKTLVWDDALTFHARPLRHRVVTHAFEIDLCVRQRRLDQKALSALKIPQGPLWGELQRGRSVRLDDQEISPDAVSVLETVRARAICGGDNADPEILTPFVEGLDVLIHEATYTEEIAARVGAAPMHSSAAQVARFAQTHAIPNLILTHFSPRYHGGVEVLAAEARRNYEGNLVLAEDGRSWTLAEDGRLHKNDS